MTTLAGTVDASLARTLGGLRSAVRRIRLAASREVPFGQGPELSVRGGHSGFA